MDIWVCVQNLKIENMPKISFYTLCMCLCLSLGLSSCKSDTKAPILEPLTNEEAGPIIPLAEQSFVQDLFNRVDQIDYIYHSFDFSMSISEPNAIKSNIATLSGLQIGAIPANCKPVGRQMFMSKGEMLAEADLYFNGACQFLVFVEKEKPVSGSTFNQRGIDFYNQVFTQAKGVNK